jgi:hypothetical protein
VLTALACGRGRNREVVAVMAFGMVPATSHPAPPEPAGLEPPKADAGKPAPATQSRCLSAP